ncbi:ABC transporter permease subunit [Streptomyces uncialis]|uniref:ABC transporter permease subunit n=1 Tax=Streptomyces uncialis TaxID=1048205 RepID=UPI0038301C9D
MTMGASWAVLTAELTKIRTVRSTLWTFVLTFLVSVAIGLSLGLAVRGTFDDRTPQERANFDAVYTGFQGLTFSQIILLVFGVLVVSTEYTSGTIRTSLAAVPRRGLFYGAKITVGTLLAAGVALASAFLTFFVAQAALGPHSTSFDAPGSARAVWGAALYMTLMCAFAMGAATMLRSSVLALALLVPLFFIVSPILNIIPGVEKAARYLPDQAGAVLMRVVERDDMTTAYGPGTAVLVLVAWTVAAVLGGYAVLHRRDA